MVVTRSCTGPPMLYLCRSEEIVVGAKPCWSARSQTFQSKDPSPWPTSKGLFVVDRATGFARR